MVDGREYKAGGMKAEAIRFEMMGTGVDISRAPHGPHVS